MPTEIQEYLNLILPYWWIGALVLGVVLLPFVMIFIGILKNWPPIWDSPGPSVRIRRYLTENIVETSVDPYWLDMQVRHYRVNEEQAFKGIIQAIEDLGWAVHEINEEERTAHAVVQSLIFRFKDDVRIWMRESARTDGVSVHLRSSSRIGRGDLGANARHVLDFYDALNRSLGIPGRI